MTTAVQDHGDGPSAGRRRGSSRRRADRLGALPGWLAWTLRSGIALVSLVPALVAVLVVQALSPAAQQVPAGLARFELAGAWLASTPANLAGYGSWWASPPFGWLQLGALLRLLQAGSGQSVLAAAHGVMLLVTLAQVALLWFVLRRGGASGLASGVAAAITGLAPAALAAHTAVSSTAIALVWLLGAVALVGFRSLPTAVLAGTFAGVAVVTSPVTAVLVLGVAAALLLPQEPRRGRVGRPARQLLGAAGALVVVLLVAGVAVAVLAGQPQSGGGRLLDAVGSAAGPSRWSLGTATASEWIARDPLTLLASTAAVVIVSPLRTYRPLVAVAVVLAVGAFWPLGGDSVAPVLLLSTVMAIAIAATVDRAVRALASPVFRRSVLGSAWLTGTAAVLTVAAVAWLLSLTALQPADRQPVAKAAAWIRSSVPDGQVVLVDLGLWPDLARDRSLRVGWYAAGSSGVRTSVPWAAADYVLADAGLVSATDAAAVQRSLPVAGFGSGSSRIEVRAVQRTTAPAPTATPSRTASTSEVRAAAARKETGAQLAQNSRITVSGSDRAALIAGDVDARIAIVLGQFVTEHRIVVASFPVTEGDGGVRRQVVISSVDGHRIPADGTATGTLLRYLSSLRGQYAAQSIDATDEGLTTTFPVDTTFVP